MSGSELKDLRKKMKLTQTEFALLFEKATMRTVQNWEGGVTPVPDYVEKLIKSKIENNTPNFVNAQIIKQSVPFYDIDFTSSFLEITNNQSTTPDSYITHPFFNGCDYVVRNSGQSMAKVINHGDAIGLVKLNNWQEFFPFGEIYAIVTNDNLRMIKVITKGETDEHYTLISKPTDSKRNEFPPQQIKKSSILSIFKVQASSHLF